MNTPPSPSPSQQPAETPRNPDLAEQAIPGHGVPSQDPDAAAQVALSPNEAAREAKSAYVGGGAMAGLASGALAGAAIGGPIGVLVGATAGTIVGVLGGEAAGQAAEANPSVSIDRLPIEAERRSADDDVVDGS